MFNSPDVALDSDRRSIRSSTSGRAASGSAPHTSGSRFGQILGLDKLNRQRGKTLSEQGPALGSLSKSQSQSLPRNDEGDETTGSGRRRNSSHSGNFFGINLGRTTGHTKSIGAESLPSQKHIAVRRRPFNMFGSKTDGWAAILGQDRAAALNERSNLLSNLGKDDGRSSPRPISVHSNELPRPSQDSSSWGLWSANEPFNQRSSPLSSDWMAAPALTHNMWGSRQPSRRPSIQHGQSGGSLSYDMLDDGIDNNSTYAFSPPQTSVNLAPIGTKPAHMLKRNVPDPKLNPAAKDFRSLFSRPSSTSSDVEDEEDDKINLIGATPLTSPSKAPHQPLPLNLDPESSPEIGRQSRDAHSINTASSVLSDSRDSLDRSISYTASDSAPSTSVTSNKSSSLMSKLTRKHSSGKFQFPTFSRSTTEKSKRESTQLLDVEDEDIMSKSMESEKGKGSVRSWSSVFGVGKKKDKVAQTPKEETPSLSGASHASTDHEEEN
ncbi:hypothetical protein KCU63_g9336, partial [Aureobasidium melanogenum]